ncbi:hypothetical protein [Solibacillus sp. FSL W7-1324]|uniref:hypothetical protein n=1 Tax=Solibacillus sp. FSL W7-1324 TaxID=2921701 RepID=UPI0030FAD512
MEMMYDSSGIGLFALIGLLPMLFNLVIIIFVIYFIVKAIKFMDMKQKLDQEKNEKIDQLI